MAAPLVRCDSCAREWHSETMADGLRLLTSCPRCTGTLVFSDAAPASARTDGPTKGPGESAPHLVLGVPRR